jgi:hypothetical protein
VLRITRDDDSIPQKLRLEGRLVGEWVEVLRKTWSELARPDGGKAIVDLCEVSFADRDGRALLAELQRSGAELINASEFMRHMLADGSDD